VTVIISVFRAPTKYFSVMRWDIIFLI
jgi:hypothetical protein